MTDPVAAAPAAEPISETAPRDAVTQAVTRGAARAMADRGCAVITEFELPNGRRADLFALAADGEIAIVEVKSGLEDFRTDAKWPEYFDYCDRLYFAVAEDFPREILPEDVGLIIADGFGGAVLRPSPVSKLAPARRRALTLRAARVAAGRLMRAKEDISSLPT
ncbi:MAG: DNA repair putative endonuclease MmcB [Maricaulaceae bacterium]|jgi:hypothetical protein